MVSGAQHAHKRKYRPLDVKTWFEGSLRLIGWILVIVLAVVTGGIWMIYELMVLNGHDADFRDIYFDQRLTNNIANRYHKNFLLAENCCNLDPVFFPSSCNEQFPDSWYTGPPYCKPLIMIECTDIRSAACNSTRGVLYESVGLSIGMGPYYEDCLRAGMVRVGAQTVSVGRPITLVAYYQFQPTGDTLVIQSPFNINTTEVRDFVKLVAGSVPEEEVSYVQPNTRLSATLALEGTRAYASLTQQHDGRRGIRAPPPYNSISNLWPWPGMNGRCDNTFVTSAYFISGDVVVAIPRFSLSRPDEAVLTLAAGNDTILVGAWKVERVEKNPEQVGASEDVEVSYLTEIQAAIGQVPLMGACGGWQFSSDPNDLQLTYSLYWTGKLEELQGGTTFGPFTQVVKLGVADVGRPRFIQLPFYGGMFYIFNAFVMAFIWMVSNGLMLFIIILVWWNVRSNKGLPPIIYRYMQKYRGW